MNKNISLIFVNFVNGTLFVIRRKYYYRIYELGYLTLVIFFLNLPLSFVRLIFNHIEIRPTFGYRLQMRRPQTCE